MGNCFPYNELPLTPKNLEDYYQTAQKNFQKELVSGKQTLHYGIEIQEYLNLGLIL